MGLKILVIGAHVDDAEVGAGGTIARHIDAGDKIQWHTMISKGYRVPVDAAESILIDEFKDAMTVLDVKDYHLHDFCVDTLDRVTGLRDRIYKLWYKFNPDVAYVHWRGSRHQDHRAVGQCCFEVSWRCSADTFAYVVPNDYLGFEPNVFSLVDKKHYEKKLTVIACYRSQYQLRPWFTNDLIDNHAKAFAVFARGDNSHVEPFEQIRRLLY